MDRFAELCVWEDSEGSIRSWLGWRAIAWNAYFFEGGFVYVDPDVAMQPGDVVAVRCGYTTLARRLTDEDGRRVLRAVRPDRSDRVVNAANETRIHRVVVVRGRKVCHICW